MYYNDSMRIFNPFMKTNNMAIVGRRDYNPKLGYLQDFHRSSYQGGSVSATAPFGTTFDNKSTYKPPESV